jgi:hypothetical protein
MSADNGIYILQTRDQYRVTEASAIDNLHWDNKTMSWSKEIVPTRVLEYFGNCKYTRDEATALKIAASMLRRTPICEYGINFIKVNKFWRQIVREGKEHAAKELAFLQQCGNQRFEHEINVLQNILAE